MPRRIIKLSGLLLFRFYTTPQISLGFYKNAITLYTEAFVTAKGVKSQCDKEKANLSGSF